MTFFKKRNNIQTIILSLLLVLTSTGAYAQTLQRNNGANNLPTQNNQFGGDNDSFGGNRNSHGSDSTSHKKIPRGITVWTIDEVTGERTEAEPDTTSFMRMNHMLGTGIYGEYQNLGNNGSPRISRIFINREEDDDFIFINTYSQVLEKPGEFHFTNTFSPITNLVYNSCGNKVNGEDHLKATFAVNASKRLGFGFKFNYLYARGYYANQNLAHFGYTMWSSYIGNRYKMHAWLSLNHHKQSENGGITNDEYITHPESFSENFASNEIPTVLKSNWNKQDNQHFFLTQSYSVGFTRKVPMTEKEIEAKKFADASKKEKEEKEAREKKGLTDDGEDSSSHTLGRPSNAKIMGDEPAPEKTDSGRIKEGSPEANDSLLAEKKKAEENEFMKDEYVPVTSFFHTLQLDHYQRAYIAYQSPENLYLNDYYALPSDSINDRTKHTHIKNTLGVSLLEGFNKWAKAGIHIFAANEMSRFSLPEIDGSFNSWTAKKFSVGGGITKKEGKTFHFDARGEFFLIGDQAGTLDINGKADINIPLLGDTAVVDLMGGFSISSPSDYFTKYSSRHFQWNLEDEIDNETRLHLEGNLSFEKTKSRLRVAIDNITNYTYFGTTYNVDDDYKLSGLDIKPRQASDVQVVTAQLYQNFKLGILHWNNIVTYQKSTDEWALPLPRLNLYSNLFIRFKIAGVLATDFGADVRYFTKYYAPEYSPQMLSYAIQENKDRRTEVGNYPICNIYANFELKTCRFYIMMSHVNGSGKGNYFFTPHHPMNASVLRIGLNWNFYN